MYRLVPCIPILGSFFIKNEKRMCICDYVILILVLVKMCVFGLGYKQIIALDSSKTHY